MELIELRIKGISFSQTQTGAYALILEEKNGDKKLPIIIGSFEAQSIALALEQDIKAPRPITHDLLATIMRTYYIGVNNVVIHKLEDGVFYSNLECEDINNKVQVIDSRTSDAIAVALRFDAPIYTTKEVMEKAGIYLDVENMDENPQLDYPIGGGLIEGEEEIMESEIINELLKDYTVLTDAELKHELENAVRNEDYEKAAQIRDELNKRK